MVEDAPEHMPMLHKLGALRGATVHAVDGDIGSIADFLFDDERWVVRYALVDTGSWLTRRRVVLSVLSLTEPDWSGPRVDTGLTREQVRNSPDISTHEEVSRAMESELLSYYGHPNYWGGSSLWAAAPNPVIPDEAAATIAPDPREEGPKTHLRGYRQVVGYHLRARDGEIGHIDDFLVDAEHWAIDSVIVDTSNWIGGRWVALSPSSFGQVDWMGRHIRVNLARETIAAAPEYDAEEKTRPAR